MTGTLNRPAGQLAIGTQKVDASRAPHLPEGQSILDTYGERALGEPTSAAANEQSLPRPVVLQQNPTTTSGHGTYNVQTVRAAGGSNFGSDQADLAAHSLIVAAEPNSPDSHVGNGSHVPSAVRGPILRDPFLALLADAVDDLERVRIASENRYRQLTRTGDDTDGEERGLGLSDSIPEVLRAHQLVDGLIDLEHKAVLNLQRQIRKHPLWTNWGKTSKGVGEKQLARLLAAIGDPYWNDLHDRPRTVSELWAYCGFHVIDGHSARRAKGSKVNWSTAARMRAWLITGACLKAQGHYSDVYYAARAKYESATHHAECVRCGPKGIPALAGSPLSAAHQHARALRAIAKELLKDLWLTARDIHQGELT